jgi:hypothetical protein
LDRLNFFKNLRRCSQQGQQHQQQMEKKVQNQKSFKFFVWVVELTYRKSFPFKFILRFKQYNIVQFFATGVVDTSDKFVAGIVDTGAKFATRVSMPPVVPVSKICRW